jgi:hypothetical protein
MSKSLITFLLVFGWIIYLKPEASIKPFSEGTIKIKGNATFNANHIECRHKKKEIKIPYDSIAFMIRD